ncbi:ribonuclease E inhibitor RraB [Flavobacterium sp. YJ01]|uniref:ribonuclease E inhibitor RraB n=1 Tax=unclassified Flavobacterium TaxID=196869 RepID=UPI0023E352FC|nr:ribonuclease E inhibitor RraB [Flavobacterium sp. YJ01]WET01781.1 ribonuclease E inhibitor RraB [Flavobacterium sp. YJ01]
MLSFLKPKKQKRLVSDNDFNANLVKHYRLATESLVSLRDAGIEEEDELRIDFFFYADTRQKAEALEMGIQEKDFSANFETALHDKNLFIISGKTGKIKMMHETLSKWVTEMSELGYGNDCIFDSWSIDSELK